MSDEVRVLWDLHEGEGQGISSNPLPNLKSLEVRGEIKLTSIVFPNLSFLQVIPVVGDAKFLFSSSENEGCLGTFSQFPKLEQLNLLCCPGSVQQFIKDDGSTAMLNFCGQLRSLTLYSALNMEVVSLHLFKSLRDIDIYGLTCEYLSSADGGFEQFQSLEKLTIEDCPDLEVIIRGGDKDKAFVFPRLQNVIIKNCPNMKSFSPGVLRAPKLQLVTVDDKPYPIAEIEDLNHVLKSANSSDQTATDKNDL